MLAVERTSVDHPVLGLMHGRRARSGILAGSLCVGLTFVVLGGAGCADRHGTEVAAMGRSGMTLDAHPGPGSTPQGPMDDGPDRDSSRSSDGSPFTLQQTDGRWWIVSPGGTRFFSLGVNVVTQGLSKEDFDPENPGYAAWQHHADDRAWAEATQRRLLDWGFTTIGGWSDLAVLRGSTQRVPGQTAVLHIGSTAGAPWFDLWDPNVIDRMDEVARERILALRDDPRLIGYYSDNELGWWNATLFDMTLKQPATSGQRQRLVRLLRDHYEGDWTRLLADLEPESVDGWEALERRGTLRLRPGGQGVRVMRRFLSLVADRYYQLVHDIIRRYDTRALILGDRYQSFFYPEVARAAVPYVDAISTNLNAHWNDGSFLRCYLDTLHGLTGKPVVVGEFYMAATENRSGNRNTSGVFPVVPTQAARAAALQTTLRDLARLPYVVGADWFQYFDEPRHGREDGENFNFGLVDLHDRPYEEVTAVFSSADMAGLRARPLPARTDASAGVPRAPKDPFADLVPTRALVHWDRERGFVRPCSEFPMADLYLCWAPESLVVGVYATDILEETYYRSRSVPKVDRMLWTVRLNDRTPISARIGAGREGLVSGPAVRLEGLSGLGLDVRTIAILEIPARLLDRPRLREGDRIDLHSTLVTHGRAYRVEWQGSFTLRGRSSP